MRENKAKINIRMENKGKGIAVTKRSIKGPIYLLLCGITSICEVLLENGVNINMIHAAVDLAVQESAESEN